MNDKDRISPYIINAKSRRQVIEPMKNISLGIISDPIPNTPN